MINLKPMGNSNRAIFFDRDGTIIYDMVYPRNPELVQFLPGVREALVKLKKCGYQLVLVSNQSGVGRGILTHEEAEQVHQRVVSSLEEVNVKLDASYYCFHAPEEHCTCRKPSPEMLLRAAGEMNLDLNRSFMVGDSDSDIEAGKRAGCKTIFLTNGVTSARPQVNSDFAAADWLTILEYILDSHYNNSV